MPDAALAVKIKGRFQERAVVLPGKTGEPALEAANPKHSADYDPKTTYK